MDGGLRDGEGPRLCISASAQRRRAEAHRWLSSQRADELLVLAPETLAARDLIQQAAVALPAVFGWHRATPRRLAAQLAGEVLVDRGLVPAAPLVGEALAARVIHAMARSGSLGRYARVADGPGLPRALARTLDELRMAGVEPVALAGVAPELADALETFEASLEEIGLADRAAVLRLAGEVREHPLLGLPTLLLDVPIESAAERELLRAVVARAPSALATLPAGDERSAARLRELGFAARPPPGRLAVRERGVAAGALASLQGHLFEEAAPPPGHLDDGVRVLSAPGESRECVEIARELLALAGRGIRFDQMAVLLRSPEEYRPHLEQALARAQVPAFFARGAVRPDPSGRAFVALLACAAEGLSARRFAEYLSLGEVPDATGAGEPPAAAARSERWIAPDDDLLAESLGEALAEAFADAPPARAAGEGREAVGALAGEGGDAAAGHGREADAASAPVVQGTLRAPRRWEALLVEAAVIGGLARWERRLDGLAHELELDLAELEDEPEIEHLRRRQADLAALRGFALPLLRELASLPDRALWGGWLDALSALATRALRRPERVLAVLGELAPMADVGPVDLAEVRLVLSRRLLELCERAPASRAGRVFVGPCEAALGLCFDVVCVPGLAEKIFPRQIAEDPILLDRERAELTAGLIRNEDRVARERLALRVAVGAARQRLVLSYPRLDLEKSRPRVPSFYTLEALRAAEGALPGFDELAARAETATDARIGWPAPRRPEDAIDEAEHDLALLDGLLRLDPDESVGTARYLLDANPHLGRALRFRARRWLTSWTVADGLVNAGEGAKQAMRRHALAARSYSPTALQNYAACPYRFFLQAIHRLAPREVPQAIDELDALQRGSLVHEVQFELYGRLAEAGLLPVRPAALGPARDLLDEVLDRVAESHREQLAPAIPRVWEDGIASIRADLREWLRRTSEDESGFVPWRFELSFGLRGRRARDAHSVAEPVALDCGLALRGSIDLVERTADDRLRATDHKTGRQRMAQGGVVAGGEALQPVLYALACEKLFPELEVEAGRLYYCTAAGGFAEVAVPLDSRARDSARVLAEAVGAGVEGPFLPAAPAPRACLYCDYQVVCGPYEELRTGRKRTAELEPVRRLRALP